MLSLPKISASFNQTHKVPNDVIYFWSTTRTSTGSCHSWRSAWIPQLPGGSRGVEPLCVNPCSKVMSSDYFRSQALVLNKERLKNQGKVFYRISSQANLNINKAALSDYVGGCKSWPENLIRLEVQWCTVLRNHTRFPQTPVLKMLSIM